jgi:hypothetical protein
MIPVRLFSMLGSRLILLILFAFTAKNGDCQVPFAKHYGDSASVSLYDLVPFEDSSIFIAGKISVPGEEVGDTYLLKTDLLGEPIWTKRFDMGVNERAQSAISDGSNVYVLVNSAGFYTSKILKLDAEGNTIWSHRYSGELPNLTLNDLALVEDGFVATGYGFVTTDGITHNRMTLVKFDFNGDVIWTKIYAANVLPYNEVLYHITTTANGDFLVSGSTNSYGIGVWVGLFYTPVGFVARFTSEGELLWAKGLKETHSAFSVNESQSLDVYICSQDQDERVLITKLSPEGDLVWSRRYEQGIYDDLIRIKAFHDFGTDTLLFMGITEYLDDDIPIVMKINTDGDLLDHYQQDVIVYNSNMPAMHPTSDRGFIAGYTCETEYLFGELGLSKFDEEGNGSCRFQVIDLVMTDRDLEIVDMSFSLTSYAYSYSTSDNGEFLDLEIEGFYCCDSVEADIMYVQEEFIYNFYPSSSYGADYFWVIDGDTVLGKDVTYAFAAAGSYSVCLFVDNLCSSDSTCKTIEVTEDNLGFEHNIETKIRLYPNPVREKLFIETTGNMHVKYLVVRDLQGRIVRQFENNNWFDVKELEAGMYVLSVQYTDDLSEQFKFFKE